LPGKKVYELAQELNIPSKELLKKLREMDIDAKSHLNVLDEEHVALVKRRIRGTYTVDFRMVGSERKVIERKPVTVPKPPVVETKPSEVVETKAPEVVETKSPEVVKRLWRRTAVSKVGIFPPKRLKPGRGKYPPRKKEREEQREKELGEKPLKMFFPKKKTSVVEEKVKEKRKTVKIGEVIGVGELAKRLNVKATDLIKKLLELGMMVSINQTLDGETAAIVIHEYGYEPEIVPLYQGEVLEEEEDISKRIPRPPVVTIMGHVDHGKTSLLDAIRQTHVTESEAGGITQHIGAYVVTLIKGTVVFLDTPGHEAFTAMRARGAKVTDIVVLVVAADEGVMPQTVEAIDHARAAGVPIVVAINKIDKPEARPEQVKRQLSELGLTPEEWGGKTIFVEVSAKKKIGLENLLEMILLEAEMLELKANSKINAKGTVIESRLDRGFGPVATVLVQKGTLRIGDAFVAGTHYGRIRALIDDRGRRVREAGPSTPVEVLGFSGVPQAGDIFQGVTDERKAREISIIRMEMRKAEEAKKIRRITLSDLHQKVQEGKLKELKLVLKVDVHGSAEAVSKSLTELSNENVKVNIIHKAVGNITESDVMLAAASEAIVIGFSVRPETRVLEIARQEQVDIHIYDVIYDVINDVRKAMEGLLEPQYQEVILGKVEVREIFNIPRIGMVAGCYVIDGKVVYGGGVRLFREGNIIYTGKIASLRRFKEDVKEVNTGYECGLTLENFQEIRKGDQLEVFIKEAISPARVG